MVLQKPTISWLKNKWHRETERESLCGVWEGAWIAIDGNCDLSQCQIFTAQLLWP